MRRWIGIHDRVASRQVWTRRVDILLVSDAQFALARRCTELLETGT